jgi:plastocyanin
MVMKMKWNIIFVIGIVLLLLAGCAEKKEAATNVVENLPGENATNGQAGEASAAVEDETKDLEGLSTKEMIEKLSKEAGIETNSTETESAAEETNATNETAEAAAPGVTEIVIESLNKFDPKDPTIKVGETIKWTSNQVNFQHVINVQSENQDNYNQIVFKSVLKYNQSVEFKFEKAGTYTWVSTSSNRYVQGTIKVV